jgi:hypothetical protein
MRGFAVDLEKLSTESKTFLSCKHGFFLNETETKGKKAKMQIEHLWDLLAQPEGMERIGNIGMTVNKLESVGIDWKRQK